MSRFSKSEAEARGWVFVHAEEATTEITSETQGEQRTRPGSYTAERYFALPGRSAKRITEQADTLGKLLEQIHAFERQAESKIPDFEPAPVDTSGELRGFTAVEGDIVALDEAAQTVVLPGGETVTDAEWAARDTGDVVVDRFEDDDDPTQRAFFGGNAAVREGAEERLQVAQDAEDERTAGEAVDHRQVFVDNSNTIDAPGQSAPSQLVVREGEGSIGEVSLRREAEKSQAEDDRVNADEEARQERKLEETSAPLPEPTPTAADIRFDAQEELAKEQRDDDLTEADSDESLTEIREAGAEAEQEAHDEARDEVTERDGDLDTAEQHSTETDATPAARKLAEEKGVDLTAAKGTGSESRVTKADVEKILDKE